MGALFGILALVAIIAIAQPAYAANVQVTISKGASVTSNSTACRTTNCFDPSVVNVNVGDTITWTNDDTAGHTATSGQPTDNTTGTVFDSSLISAGKSYTTAPFTTAGTYNYFCQVHPWMVGQVIVGAAGATSQPSSGNNMAGMNMTGNQAVPEFGPVASLVLVIAIISVIAFTAKTRGLPKL
ncbi:MAG: plastocyanin/azurin family copper-binding protein [Nitrosotalea sp.]